MEKERHWMQQDNNYIIPRREHGVVSERLAFGYKGGEQETSNSQLIASIVEDGDVNSVVEVLDPNGEGVIICDRCSKILSDYISLNCQHNFCLECMAISVLKGEGKVIQSTPPNGLSHSTFQQKENIYNSSPIDIIEMRCFSCGEDSELGYQSTQAIDIFIQILIKKYEQKQQLLSDHHPIYASSIFPILSSSSMTTSYPNQGKNDKNPNQSGGMTFISNKSNQDWLNERSHKLEDLENNSNQQERIKQSDYFSQNSQDDPLYLNEDHKNNHFISQITMQEKSLNEQDNCHPTQISVANENIFSKNQMQRGITQQRQSQDDIIQYDSIQNTQEQENECQQQYENQNQFENELDNYQYQGYISEIRDDGKKNRQYSNLQQNLPDKRPDESVKINSIKDSYERSNVSYSIEKQNQLVDNYSVERNQFPSNYSIHSSKPLQQNNNNNNNHYISKSTPFIEDLNKTDSNETQALKKEQYPNHSTPRQTRSLMTNVSHQMHNQKTDSLPTQFEYNTLEMSPIKDKLINDNHHIDAKKSYVDQSHRDIVRERSEKREMITPSHQQNCKLHPLEELNLFCFSCDDRLLCMKCLQSGQHKNHDVQRTQKCFPYLIKKMNETSHSISQTIEYLYLQEMQLQQKHKECVKQIDTTQKHFRSNLNEAHLPLRDKQQQLLEQAYIIFTNQGEQLTKNIKIIQNHIETLKEVRNHIDLICSSHPQNNPFLQNNQNNSPPLPSHLSSLESLKHLQSINQSYNQHFPLNPLFQSINQSLNTLSEVDKLNLFHFYSECKSLLSNLGLPHLNVQNIIASDQKPPQTSQNSNSTSKRPSHQYSSNPPQQSTEVTNKLISPNKDHQIAQLQPQNNFILEEECNPQSHTPLQTNESLTNYDSLPHQMNSQTSAFSEEKYNDTYINQDKDLHPKQPQDFSSIIEDVQRIKSEFLSQISKKKYQKQLQEQKKKNTDLPSCEKLPLSGNSLFQDYLSIARQKERTQPTLQQNPQSEREVKTRPLEILTNHSNLKQGVNPKMNLQCDNKIMSNRQVKSKWLDEDNIQYPESYLQVFTCPDERLDSMGSISKKRNVKVNQLNKHIDNIFSIHSSPSVNSCQINKSNFNTYNSFKNNYYSSSSVLTERNKQSQRINNISSNLFNLTPNKLLKKQQHSFTEQSIQYSSPRLLPYASQIQESKFLRPAISSSKVQRKLNQNQMKIAPKQLIDLSACKNPQVSRENYIYNMDSLQNQASSQTKYHKVYNNLKNVGASSQLSTRLKHIDTIFENLRAQKEMFNIQKKSLYFSNQ